MQQPPSARPPVSVVVCTLDRAEALRQCLDALAGQTHGDFETIVVVGPGDKMTRGFLAGCPQAVVVSTPQRNVSVARNAGMAAAAGLILAFCDDDAVARPDWLQRLVEAFEDDRVGAAGGTVLDGRTDPPKAAFRNGIVRLSGRQIEVRERPGEYHDPRGPWFNRVCGCNFALRREAVERIGGFDEFIEFASDETEICLRLIAAGWRVQHRPQAVVVHTYEPGVHRQDALLRNWYAELKNQMYVGLKHRRNLLTAAQTTLRGAARLMRLGVRLGAAALTGRIGGKQARSLHRDARRGYVVGLRTGWTAGRMQKPSASA